MLNFTKKLILNNERITNNTKLTTYLLKANGRNGIQSLTVSNNITFLISKICPAIRWSAEKPMITKVLHLLII